MIRKLQQQVIALRKDSRVPLAVSGLFALFAALSIWNTVVSFQVKNQLTTDMPQIRRHALAPIADQHIFGAYVASAASLPQTELQLKLSGVLVAASSNATSRALISTPDGKTKVYANGDALPGGATIKHIYHNYVVLNDNGRLERLNLPVPKVRGS